MLFMYNHVYGKSLSVVALVIAISTIMLAQSLPTHVANALVTRDFSYLHDNHCTALYSCAGALICGDHLCEPGEYGKYIENMSKAQISQGAAAAAVIKSKPLAPAITSPAVPTANVTEKIDTEHAKIIDVQTHDFGANDVISLVTLSYNGTLLVNHLVLTQTNSSVKTITAWLSPDWTVNISGNKIMLDSDTSSISNRGSVVGIITDSSEAEFGITEAAAH